MTTTPRRLSIAEFSDLHDLAIIEDPSEADAAYDSLSPRLQKLWDDYARAKVSDFLADFYVIRGASYPPDLAAAFTRHHASGIA